MPRSGGSQGLVVIMCTRSRPHPASSTMSSVATVYGFHIPFIASQSSLLSFSFPLMLFFIFGIQKQQQWIIRFGFPGSQDFVWLRDLLCRIFPGVFIPPLPPKKILSSNDDIVSSFEVHFESFPLLFLFSFLFSSPIPLLLHCSFSL